MLGAKLTTLRRSAPSKAEPNPSTVKPRTTALVISSINALITNVKRPRVKIGDDELTQIKKYAYTVADDERFSKTQVEWDFVVVSNELDAFAEREAPSCRALYDLRSLYFRGAKLSQMGEG